METQHLNQYELPKSWRISQRTLESWRWLMQGLPYLKLGQRVVYRLCDLELYESESLRNSGGGDEIVKMPLKDIFIPRLLGMPVRFASGTKTLISRFVELNVVLVVLIPTTIS